jgi:urea transporter
MAKFTRVEVKDGKIVLSRRPDEVPADHVSNAQVDSASSRLFKVLGIAAVIFLAFAGVIVLIGVRAKARKARETPPDA